MSRFKSTKVDNNIEKRILTHMIVSTEFLKEISEITEPTYFTVPYIETISEWVLDYYDSFKQAPFMDIQPIFEQKEIKLKEQTADLIRQLLNGISEQYSENPKINIDYLKEQTIDYFQKRELEITASNVKYHLEQGNIIQAEEEILKFNKILVATSQCVNMFDKEVVEKAFEETEEGLFRIPGYLGEFIGPLQRGWLIALQGGYKKGKTWWLLNLALMACMDNLKVIFFSLEMSQSQIIKRMMHCTTGLAKEAGEKEFPVFDCIHNQNDDCQQSERPDQFSTYRDGKKLSPQELKDEYTVCTYCQKNRPELFALTTWKELYYCKELTKIKALQKAEVFKRAHGTRFKLKTYPRFSANIQDIKHALDILESTEDFVPDVIIIDYADILKPESGGSAGIEKEDATWIALAQLAGERHALVVTPTQITKDGQKTKLIGVEHTARWSGKLGHVDAILGINQTDEEKDKGVQRLNIIMHRHEDFNPMAQCMVLQNFDIGAVHLDSCPYRDSEE